MDTNGMGYNGSTNSGNGAATAALVCGLLSLVLGVIGGWFLWPGIVGLVLGIVAIVMASMAKKQGYSGSLGTAGFVTGILGVVFCGIFIACYAYCTCQVSKTKNAIKDAFSSSSDYDYEDLEDSLKQLQDALEDLD